MARWPSRATHRSSRSSSFELARLGLQLLLREQARLDAHGELDLFGRVQQRDLSDLLQVVLHRVGGGARDRGRIDGHLVLVVLRQHERARSAAEPRRRRRPRRWTPPPRRRRPRGRPPRRGCPSPRRRRVVGRVVALGVASSTSGPRLVVLLVALGVLGGRLGARGGLRLGGRRLLRRGGLAGSAASRARPPRRRRARRGGGLNGHEAPTGCGDGIGSGGPVRRMKCRGCPDTLVLGPLRRGARTATPRCSQRGSGAVFQGPTARCGATYNCTRRPACQVIGALRRCGTSEAGRLTGKRSSTPAKTSRARVRWSCRSGLVVGPRREPGTSRARPPARRHSAPRRSTPMSGDGRGLPSM